MNKGSVFFVLLLALFLGGLGGFLGGKLSGGSSPTTLQGSNSSFNLLGLLQDSSITIPEGLNFVAAANLSRPTVVYIATKLGKGAVPPGMEGFEQFFDPDAEGGSGGSGSGVIIAEDGYIVTNHHVVKNADEIEVILADKRSYTAKVLGSDANSDIALLKIEEKGLPFATFGNSDKIQIGEWVLAVGAPFDLLGTVTAGIVSAKSRQVFDPYNRSALKVESYIQTDAAVNPGNSGGALVNLRGELVGINTAIATNTGSFAGYSFAVPSILVKKIVEDFRKFGEVQRGLLGVSIGDIDAKEAKRLNLSAIKGVLVREVNSNSSAKEAGIEPGDVIISINGVEVNAASELIEQVSRFRPGDVIAVSWLHKNEEKTAKLKLRSASGGTKIVPKKAVVQRRVAALKSVLRELSASELSELRLKGGISVSSIEDGSPFTEAGVVEDFIITKVDKRNVSKIAELEKIIKDLKGAVLFEGVYPDGKRAYYAVALE